MKEFFVTLKQTEKVTRSYLYFYLGYCLIGVAFGMFMSLNILLKWGARNHLGALMILMMAAIMTVFFGLLVFPASFQQALSMGKVRKYLFAGSYLLWLRNTLVMLLIALGVSVVEELAYSRVVGESVKLLDMELFLGNPLVFVTTLLCAPTLILFMGGMILRFGVHILWGGYRIISTCRGICQIKSKLPG